MSEAPTTLSYLEAAAVVRAYAAGLACKPHSQKVRLLDALGRVLAEPVLADRAQPPFARSTRDGFACQAAALAGGAALQVIGLLRAGQAWQGGALGPAEAVEIMTGAPLPAGADCVVMVEHVVRAPSARGELISSRGESIRLVQGRTLRAGENFIPAGAEAACGVTLVAAGTRLQAAHLAAAAAVGAAWLRVYHRPRVAILSTGDELVPIEAEPRAFEVRNSNSYSLAAQVLAAGGEPILQPIAADSLEALERGIRAALAPIPGGDGGKDRSPELLLLSGGVSMGKYDLVEGALSSLGAWFRFTGVRMQPGKPVVFGELAGLGGRPFFGLPGNPVSTMVTFALFAAPVLAALGGQSGYAPSFAEARLTQAVPLKPGLRRFLPAYLEADAESARVTPVAWQGSGDIAATAQANCLLVAPELESAESETLAPGATVRVLLL